MTVWLFCLTSEEIDLFVDLWEEQHFVWDPAHKDYENKGACGTVMASIVEAFGHRWTIERVLILSLMDFM